MQSKQSVNILFLARVRALFDSLMHTAIWVIGLASIALIAFQRLVDGDEGFYVAASMGLSQGLRLYQDFVFNQMPGVPYLYQFWMEVFGYNWLSARALSALLTFALAISLYHYVRRQVNATYFAYIALILLLLNCLFVFWFVTVKTYALSGVLLFSATVLLSLTVTEKSGYISVFL
jgi:4-amino-4-deoxy-L-arabinose transferase-like glycosyltransferase